MHRSVQVGIAVLVLSVRLWNKLFFVSDFFKNHGLTEYLTQEFITKALIGFFITYYILVKVIA